MKVLLAWHLLLLLCKHLLFTLTRSVYILNPVALLLCTKVDTCTRLRCLQLLLLSSLSVCVRGKIHAGEITQSISIVIYTSQ
jgi:hypothetical protein